MLLFKSCWKFAQYKLDFISEFIFCLKDRITFRQIAMYFEMNPLFSFLTNGLRIKNDIGTQDRFWDVRLAKVSFNFVQEKSDSYMA